MRKPLHNAILARVSGLRCTCYVVNLHSERSPLAGLFVPAELAGFACDIDYPPIRALSPRGKPPGLLSAEAGG